MTVHLPLPLPSENAEIISNSEVDAFLTCQRKHYLSYILNREPVSHGRSLTIGIIGHEVLAAYYAHLMNNPGDSKGAYQAGIKKLTEHMQNGTSVEILSIVQILFNRYTAQDTLATGVEILFVEEDFYLPIMGEYWYALRLDLMVKATRGRRAGQVILVDHKFTYDFYTPDDLKLNPQMPKYIIALRNNGFDVQEAYINQFRTRFSFDSIKDKSDEDLFKREPVGHTAARGQGSIKQQIIVSERIIDRRKMPPSLQEQEAVPVLNKMICRNCPFKHPCQMIEEGMSPDKAVSIGQFQKRTYGYGPHNDAD